MTESKIMPPASKSTPMPPHEAVVAPLPPTRIAAPAEVVPVMSLRDVSVTFSGKMAVRGVSFDIPINEVTSLIGPSGSGKTTLLRTLNRLHDLVPGATVSGEVLLGHLDIYEPSFRTALLRSRVGMVFQRPNPFPTMSIYDNVVSGLRFNGVRRKALLDEAAESSLIAAAFWDSVRDRLGDYAGSLSGGEQQRLCIARALAVEPEVLLMDEPTSALDPVAMKHIEELIGELKDRVTIVIVTHNMQQASRVSDRCAFMLMGDDKAGELIEYGPTGKIFSDPSDPRTMDYVNGRFG
jgi:phosphate transport system ATP-binding protein